MQPVRRVGAEIMKNKLTWAPGDSFSSMFTPHRIYHAVTRGLEFRVEFQDGPIVMRGGDVFGSTAGMLEHLDYWLPAVRFNGQRDFAFWDKDRTLTREQAQAVCQTFLDTVLSNL